jgi:ferredoxin
LSSKYHIPTKLTPARKTTLGKFRIIRGEECINCGACIKICVFGVHERDKTDLRKMAEPSPYLCKNCFACVRNCPKNTLTMIINPQYKELDNNFLSADLVLTTLTQAETGKIPVFGAGYKGKFTDRGFDGIWTDMSEIVRPTRDGIHGREYISTTIDLGRKLPDLTSLEFDADGQLKSSIPPTREVPLPILFAYPENRPAKENILAAITIAANLLGTFSLLKYKNYIKKVQPYINHIVFDYFPEILDDHDLIRNISLIQFSNLEKISEAIVKMKSLNPHLLMILKLNGNNASENPDKIVKLIENGAEIIHIHGSSDTDFIQEIEVDFINQLSSIHKHLVKKGVRDRITILASGPITKAEHVVKTIILGADGVIIDTPLLIAMECIFCKECSSNGSCPMDLDSLDIRWGAQRIINLMASWHSQMLEVLGAMGMRDVRRLRGEMGRAMFFDDLEREIFEPVFKRK